ncbi:hypothetical protein [Geothrix campi]|uniref:hypothetical protein n=1 Tax=Geothrix campi TaxID=2966450 RepID=UPI0021483657|nr:hypothetical protein [Geothrix sp. SG10]
MKARTYQIALEGQTPLLMHQDNLAFQGFLKKWQTDPANKGKSEPGDDRTPAFTWLGYAYVENGQFVIPSDNIMTLLREGGVKCPTGKGKGTFKSLTQSGIVVDQASWPLLVNEKPVPFAPFQALMDEPDFTIHEKAAADHGFQLFSKRAKIGKAKHVRVRPRFDQWAIEGTVTVLDDMITEDALQTILNFAGRYAGLCDWRPSSPDKPGRFGTFTATVKSVK